jgi:hypothetical protein
MGTSVAQCKSNLKGCSTGGGALRSTSCQHATVPFRMLLRISPRSCRRDCGAEQSTGRVLVLC